MSLVQRLPAGHDQATGATDRAAKTSAEPSAPHPFDTALQRLRLEGAVFLRAEYREPWAYQSLTGPATAAILRPGTDRVVLFHLVSSGTCWVQVEGQEKHWASAGDMIVLPYGDQHSMGGVGESDLVPLLTFLDPPPWDRMPLLRHGRDGALTDVVCGYLHSDDVLFDPRCGSSHPPSSSVPRARPGPSGCGPTSTSRSPRPRRHHSAPTRSAPGCPRCCSSRCCVSTWPPRRRSTTDGSPRCTTRCSTRRSQRCTPSPSGSGPSPTWPGSRRSRAPALDERFRQVLGRSPIRYLTEWRMHLAEDLLTSTDLGVGAIARRVGYDAEEAFSRAFKRHRRLAAGTVARAAPAPDDSRNDASGRAALGPGDRSRALRPRPRPRSQRPDDR